MKRKEAIKKLQNGEIQIFNDLLPSTKEIKKLLKEAFPEDDCQTGSFKFYYRLSNKEWSYNNQKMDLQTVNLSSISKGKNKLKQLEKSFAELSKDVAELKAKDWGSIVPSENLECDFENVKPKLELGKWYKAKQTKNIIVRTGDKSYYGFVDNKFVTHESELCSFEGEWELCDTEEVSQALIEEAKKRGYKEGVKISRKFDNLLEDLIIDSKTYSDDTEFYCNLEKDYLEHHGFVVYSKGSWAEIIDQPKEEVIDFDKAQLLVTEYGTIALSNGNHTRDDFSGQEYDYKNKRFLCVRNRFSKPLFKPFKGTLTINQE